MTKVSEKLQEITENENTDERMNKLREIAKEIGAASPLPLSNTLGQQENNLITLIINAARSKREEGLWKIAFISAIASVVSAFVALAAVFYRIID